MRQIAQVMSQAQGWNTTLVAELDRALVVLLSGHADDQQLRYSQLVDVLHRYGVSISRVAEVLSRGGLLDDDRVPAFESWLQDKLVDLAPDIAADVRAWIRALQHGGPRSHPRHPNTVRRYLRPIHPVLIEWSTRYQHLREVTTSDVTALAQSLHGHPRRHALGALGSLMRHGKKTGSIFTDPTTRIRIGHRDDPSWCRWPPTSSTTPRRPRPPPPPELPWPWPPCTPPAPRPSATSNSATSTWATGA
jgi:hypothetical protein